MTLVRFTSRGRGPHIRELGPQHVRVVVQSRDDLRFLITTSAHDHRTVYQLDLIIERATPPRPGWLGKPGIRCLGFSGEWSAANFTATLVFPESIPISVALAAGFRVATPLPTGSQAPDLAWTPAALASEATSVTLAESLTTLAHPDDDLDAHLRFTDILFHTPGEENLPHGRGLSVVIRGNEWITPDTTRVVTVDPLVHRPIGRRSTGEGEVASARSLSLPPDLDDVAVRSLRKVAVLRDWQHLTLLQQQQVQACGVVLQESEVDLTEREISVASVAGRSLALRHYTAEPLVYGWPSVSMVLVTRRPDFLHRILQMLSAQTYPRCELVVLTHGFELDDHLAAHLREVPFPAITQSIPAHLNLGEALIAGSSLASGDLIAKIDDDDFYGPEHVWDLVTARMYSGAQIVGKALDHIYLAGAHKTVFRPTYKAEKYADFVAGGTFLISQGDLREVGGWRPVPKSVDKALLDRVLINGGLVYRTHGLGYIYVRHATVPNTPQSNTSQVSDAHFETKVHSSVPGVDTVVLGSYS